MMVKLYTQEVIDWFKGFVGTTAEFERELKKLGELAEYKDIKSIILKYYTTDTVKFLAAAIEIYNPELFQK